MTHRAKRKLKSLTNEGQGIMGMIVSSVIGLILILAATDILNYLNKTQRSTSMSQEFTMWKSTITGMVRNQNQCSVAVSGNYVDTNSACPGANDVVVHWPAGCSNSTYVNQEDCANAGGTWTQTDWIKSSGTFGKGLEATKVCIEQINQIGNGPNRLEKVYTVKLDIEARKQADQQGSRYLISSPYFLVTTNSDTPPKILHCGGPSDSWVSLTTTNAPTGRSFHGAVWSYNKMIVWGGDSGSAVLNTGGLYDPLTNSWSATTTTNAPTIRRQFATVWSGSEMIVWGGCNFGCGTSYNTGARYNASSNSWTAMSSSTLTPTPRYAVPSVWSGNRLYIWGGYNGSSYLNSGSYYDPNTNSWTALSSTNAPTTRAYHTGVYTGTKIVFWGGYNGAALNSGGVLDISANSWSDVNATSAPSIRERHTAVYESTNGTMIVWGGRNGTTYYDTGGKYNVSGNSWSSTSNLGPPQGVYDHTAIWTGNKMVVWGGSTASAVNTGGVYTPSTDKWAETTLIGVPAARTNHTAVWGEGKMYIWGGSNLNTGAIYTPAEY